MGRPETRAEPSENDGPPPYSALDEGLVGESADVRGK